MDLRAYQVIVTWSDIDRTFIAEMPELPGCMADGRTQEEALASLRVIACEWIETAEALGRPVPQPKGRQLDRRVQTASACLTNALRGGLFAARLSWSKGQGNVGYRLTMPSVDATRGCS